MKHRLSEMLNAANGFGFMLIVGSVLYFIIGNVVTLVHGDMLDWTFCSSAHRLFGVEWCGIDGGISESGLDHFIHRLMNVTIPWFMMLWGVVIVSLCSVLFKLFAGFLTPAERR